jgi:PAS domain S-box-containing protein
MTRKAVHEHRLFASIRDSPFSCVITDPRLPDNPICAVNPAFETLTGYSAKDVVGRNCRLLAGPGTDRAASARLSRAIEERRPELVELLNYRRDGTAFMNAVMITPSFNDMGDLVYFVGSQIALPGSTIDDSAERRNKALMQLDILTGRQRQVLSLMSRGLRNKQIAVELGINEKTVKMHRAAMLRRLRLRTSMDAVRLAVEARL